MEVRLSRGGTQSVEAFDRSSREADGLSNRTDESDTDSFDWVPDDNSGERSLSRQNRKKFW